MESDDKSSIPSRQLTEDLFSSDVNVLAGQSFASPVRRVAGYSGINVLAFSDRTFLVRVEESSSPTGPWQETNRFPSALDGAGLRQVVSTRFIPYGTFCRVFVDNTSGLDTTVFSANFLGLPIGDSPTITIPPLGSVSINDCGSGTTELSVKPDATPIGGCGSALMGARDPSNEQVDLRTDANGNLLTAGADEAPGTDIQTPVDTSPIGIGATVSLAVVPADVRRMRVQNTTPSSFIRVREVGGPAGSGILLPYLGVSEYGGGGGAVERLEAQNVGTIASSACVQFECD